MGEQPSSRQTNGWRASSALAHSEAAAGWRAQLGEETRTLQREDGALRVWQLQGGTVLFQLSGHGSEPLADAIIEEQERTVKRAGQLVAVHDWLEMKSFAVGSQARLTSYTLRRASELKRAVIGVQSPLVAMGVRTANLALRGRLQLVSSRDELRAALG